MRERVENFILQSLLSVVKKNLSLSNVPRKLVIIKIIKTLTSKLHKFLQLGTQFLMTKIFSMKVYCDHTQAWSSLTEEK